MNKIIWSCWFQGRQNAPDLVKRCLASWETLNPDWDFRCLDAETIGRYIDLGEHISLQNQTITAASLSDILRMLLLHEYGGVWVDATLYCNQPLNEWLPLAMGTGFFAFSKPAPKAPKAPQRPLASWFIAAGPGNLLLAKWAARAIRYWHERNQSNDYFWLHHQFGDLCSTDPEARIAWESVPKISDVSPHAIQSAGMYKPAESAGRDIDWSTPVFKLTHRLDQADYRPGCLVYHVLHSRRLVKFKPQKTIRIKARGEAHIAGLKVSTENLGDHIQILAGLQLLKRLGLAPEKWIDRDNEIASAAMLNAQRRSLGILLNGWFKTNPAEWPPHPRLTPIYLGFHVRLFQAPTLVSTKALAHYRKFGPIGCRDRYTLSLLKSHGVDAFLSHCLSLTFSRRLDDPNNQTETFIVSRDQRILEYLPNTIRSGRFICHYSGSNDFAANMRQATEYLALYRSKAKLIVTTLLHCALPALAMGIPVVVFFPPNEGPQHRSDRERFSSLQEMIRVFQLSEVDHVDWRGYTADVSRIKLDLIDRLFEMAQRWGHLPGTHLGAVAPASALPVPGRSHKVNTSDKTSLGKIADLPEKEVNLSGLPSKKEEILSELPSTERELISRIRSQKLTYLSNKRLASLASTCRSIEDANLPGIFLEAGCALGGSAILIALLKNSERPLFIYDVFGMIPPPTKEDTQDVHDRYRIIVEGKSKGIGGDNYYGYVENLYELVQSNLKSFGINLEEKSVSLIKGLVQETMEIHQPVAFAHIDVDWYEPVMTSLERVFPKLVVGGSIILDDYHDWGGCRKATDEYLRGVVGQFELDDSASSMKITRCSLPLANESVPDRHRWGNSSTYSDKPEWNDRAKLAAPLIPDGAHVLEIGVGAGNLRDLLRHRCIYVGADLEPLDADTIALNMDHDSLPHEHYDCIVALGVFEYLHQPQVAAAKIALATNHIVLTYCCVREKFPSAIEIRSKRGWVNHFSEAEFTLMFALLGFGVASRTTFNATNDFEQIIFEFRRN